MNLVEVPEKRYVFTRKTPDNTIHHGCKMKRRLVPTSSRKIRNTYCTPPVEVEGGGKDLLIKRRYTHRAQRNFSECYTLTVDGSPSEHQSQ